MKKEIISVLLVTAIFILLMPCTFADNDNTSVLDYLTFDKSRGAITACTKTEGDIEIPAEIDGVAVTKIGASAFDSSKLTNITLPDSITEIGGYAFSRNNNLTHINLPNNLKSIGRDAFWCAYNLETPQIPEGLTSIGEGAFSLCYALRTVELPASLEEIGSQAFMGCGSVEFTVNKNNQSFSAADGVLFNKDKTELISYAKDKIQPIYTIPNGVTSINDSAFEVAKITEIKLPSGLTTISSRVFNQCEELTEIALPDTVVSIGAEAFGNCKSLASINFPEGVETIGNDAFVLTALTNVNIPQTVTSIGAGAFSYCGGNLEITVDENNPSYCDVDGVLFSKDKTKLIAFTNGKRNENYSIPYGVNEIANEAFEGCEGLSSVILPEGVTTIGDYAFGDCYDLESVTLPESLKNIENAAFFNCRSLKNIYYCGTETEWKAVEIGDNNNILRQLGINYIEVPLNVSVVKSEENGKATFTVTKLSGRNDEFNKITLYVAEWDDKGVLTNIHYGDKSEIINNVITITADIPTSDNYKFLLWDANLRPLMK